MLSKHYLLLLLILLVLLVSLNPLHGVSVFVTLYSVGAVVLPFSPQSLASSLNSTLQPHNLPLC